MMKAALHILAICLAGPALAISCGFDTECYEAQDCGESDFSAEVLLEEQIIATAFGDLIIVAVKQAETLITLFATGTGAEYLMSIGPEASRLSVHMNEGPVAMTYMGQCEGAF